MSRPTRSDPSAGTLYGEWWPVIPLVLIGAYLRLANLGGLAFRWDEDLSSLAVKAILEHGIPELASGMVYLRGGAFLYLMAASAQLLGFSELALRLPAALFGIATIPLGYIFARRLFGNSVGLLVAGLITLSIWDVEFSRYARMYAPFQFFYLLTILCLWRYRVISESLPGGLLCILLAALSVSLHLLGYTLALAFFVPLVLQGGAVFRQPRRLVFPVIAFSSVAAFFFVWREIQDYLRNLAILSDPANSFPTSEVAVVPVAESANPLLDFVQSILSRIALPDLPLANSLWAGTPALGVGLAVGLLAAAVLFYWHRWRGSANVMEVGLLAAVVVTCGLQLFNLALIATLLLAFTKREGIAAFRLPDVRFCLALMAVSFVAWLTMSLSLDLGGHASEGAVVALRRTVKQLLDFPSFSVFWGFVNEWPLMSIPALVGGLWAFDRAARRDPHEGALFLMLVFALPMVLNGFFENSREMFRYNVPFNPFYFAFVALGVAKWRDVLAAWHGTERGGMVPSLAALGTATLALLVLAVDLNPLRSWLVTTREHQNDGLAYRAFGMTRYGDFKTPAAYVSENASEDDLIIVLDCRELYNYIGRLDYWVRTGNYETQTYDDGKTLRDLYVATPLIMDLEELERTLNETPGRVKWLIASDSMLAGTRAVSEDIKDYIRSQEDHVVYVGRDGVTKVYRFDPGA